MPATATASISVRIRILFSYVLSESTDYIDTILFMAIQTFYF